MTTLALDAIVAFDWFVLGYFLIFNSGYLGLILLAGREMIVTLRRASVAGYDDIFANPLTPAISVVIPAYNEELSILETVRAALGLKYPHFEVIVVEDGSSDSTFELLRGAYDLVPVERFIPAAVPARGQLLSVHAPSGGDPLLVVRKTNTGRRSDPLNVGINASRCPLVCMVDADSLLDEDALLHVVKPFVDDPLRVLATGGVIRAANGSRIESGRLVEARMPTGWLARIQVMEYLRSFLVGRTGWSSIDGLLIISGAFGLFRRDVLLEVGGLDIDCVGEDAELVARIHRRMRSERRDYRVVFVAEPVCWTEVPDTLAVLGRQRRRWAQGLAEVLWKHKAMIGNPRYGRMGLLVLPYYLLFELLGPVIELIGLVMVVLALALGVLNLQFALLFAAAAFGYGMLLSLAALALEEMSFQRYPSWRDLGIALLAAVIEPLGYRQIHAWWRLRGLIAAIRGKDATWGVMTRSGLTQTEQ